MLTSALKMKTTWKFDIGKIRNKFAFHVLHRSFHNLVGFLMTKNVYYFFFSVDDAVFFSLSLLCDILLDFFFFRFFFSFRSPCECQKNLCMVTENAKLRTMFRSFVRLLACSFACLCSIQELKSAKPTHNYCMHAGYGLVPLCGVVSFTTAKQKFNQENCKRKSKKKNTNENESKSEMGVEATKTNPWFFKVDPLCTVFWAQYWKRRPVTCILIARFTLNDWRWSVNTTISHFMLDFVQKRKKAKKKKKRNEIKQ